MPRPFSAGTEPGTLDSARKAMMPSIAKRPLLISVRSLENLESTEMEKKYPCAAKDDGCYRQRSAGSEKRQSKILRKEESSWMTPHA